MILILQIAIGVILGLFGTLGVGMMFGLHKTSAERNGYRKES